MGQKDNRDKNREERRRCAHKTEETGREERRSDVL